MRTVSFCLQPLRAVASEVEAATNIPTKAIENKEIFMFSSFVLRRWRTDAGSPVGVATWHALSANETANHEYQAYTGRSNRQRLLAFPRMGVIAAEGIRTMGAGGFVRSRQTTARPVFGESAPPLKNPTR